MKEFTGELTRARIDFKILQENMSGEGLIREDGQNLIVVRYMKIHYTILSTSYMLENFFNEKVDLLVEIHNVISKVRCAYLAEELDILHILLGNKTIKYPLTKRYRLLNFNLTRSSLS